MASSQTRRSEPESTYPWTQPGDRWLASDAKPATAAVLDVLVEEGPMTTVDIADATGFTEQSVERILTELAGGGIVRGTQRTDRPSRYRLRR